MAWWLGRPARLSRTERLRGLHLGGRVRYRWRMSPVPVLLRSLDAITAETVSMLSALEDVPASADRREAKRRILEIRGKAQELFEWLAAVGLDEATN